MRNEGRGGVAPSVAHAGMTDVSAHRAQPCHSQRDFWVFVPKYPDWCQRLLEASAMARKRALAGTQVALDLPAPRKIDRVGVKPVPLHSGGGGGSLTALLGDAY